MDSAACWRHCPTGCTSTIRHRIGDAEFKPSGLAAAIEAGFDVPPTLITSSADAARVFVKRHGSVIYKPPFFAYAELLQAAEAAFDHIAGLVAVEGRRSARAPRAVLCWNRL